MHRNLGAFIDVLKREGEIVDVSANVDPYLEIAEIHRRTSEPGGKALLFQSVKGSEFPVATNLFGTKRRIDLAFGPKPLDLVRRIVSAAEHLLPPSFGKLWEYRDLALSGRRFGTRDVRNGPVGEVRQQAVDLEKLSTLR